MYKIVHSLMAVPSTSLILADSRTRADHNYFKYKTITASTSQHKNSFCPRTISQWISLSSDIVDSSSLNIFKNRLP